MNLAENCSSIDIIEKKTSDKNSRRYLELVCPLLEVNIQARYVDNIRYCWCNLSEKWNMGWNLQDIILIVRIIAVSANGASERKMPSPVNESKNEPVPTSETFHVKRSELQLRAFRSKVSKQSGEGLVSVRRVGFLEKINRWGNGACRWEKKSLSA